MLNTNRPSPPDAPSDAVFAALADPTRRAILTRLSQGPVTVGELSAGFPISQPAISRHLRVMEEAGLILRDRDAQRRPARIAPGALDGLGGWIDELRATMENRFDQRDGLLARMDKDD
jgi:DNA-binding transcriptional ArsR family regulator